MNNKIDEVVEEFSSKPHGSSDYHGDIYYVMGSKKGTFAPLRYVSKQLPELQTPKHFISKGYNLSDYSFLEESSFADWYQQQFGKKLPIKLVKEVVFIHHPNFDKVTEAVSVVNKSFADLKNLFVIMNGKNFPVQLGEWYAKSLFGLQQKKSSSQRGFDFVLDEKLRVEVKVHWSERTSAKGVKIKKSSLELSDHCIIIYLANDFSIRDILFLDSDFVLRKFGDKGHTIFLKDPEVAVYFFSRSVKHLDKILNEIFLKKFATSKLLQSIEEAKKNAELRESRSE